MIIPINARGFINHGSTLMVGYYNFGFRLGLGSRSISEMLHDSGQEDVVLPRTEPQNVTGPRSA